MTCPVRSGISLGNHRGVPEKYACWKKERTSWNEEMPMIPVVDRCE
jgi:hypothetical protein